jgi:hypothetical protein
MDNMDAKLPAQDWRELGRGSRPHPCCEIPIKPTKYLPMDPGEGVLSVSSTRRDSSIFPVREDHHGDN